MLAFGVLVTLVIKKSYFDAFLSFHSFFIPIHFVDGRSEMRNQSLFDFLAWTVVDVDGMSCLLLKQVRRDLTRLVRPHFYSLTSQRVSLYEKK